MAHFSLSAQVSACRVAGEPVFLDLTRDRYFRLDPAAAESFSQLEISGGAACWDDPGIERLFKTGLITPAPAGVGIRLESAKVPERSLVEEQGQHSGTRFSMLPEILLGLVRTRRAVRRGRLPLLVGQFRRTKFTIGRGASTRIGSVAAAYLASRRMIPVAPNCLVDSLAMGRFLIRRGIRVDLIFGVKLAPFGAHSWLQTDELVLNDSLGSVLDFTPIMVA